MDATDNDISKLRHEDVDYNPERRMPDFVPHTRQWTVLRPTDELSLDGAQRVWHVVTPAGTVKHTITLGEGDARNFARAMGYKFEEVEPDPVSAKDEDKDDDDSVSDEVE